MAIKEFAEHLAVKKLSENTMKSYLGYYKLFDAGLSERDLNQPYINQFLLAHTSNVTRSFLNNLFDHLGITNFKVPKLTGRKPQKKRRSLSPQEIKVLRTWLYNNKDVKFLLCFDLSYFCALRKAEVLTIKIKDFNIGEWAEDPSKACKLLIHGKGNKERYVPVPSKVMHRIIDYIQDHNKEMDQRLFNFKRTIWGDAFKEAIRSTMEHNYTTHDLRRSRATNWMRNGIDLTQVKNRLGHASVQTTQLYINLEEEKEFNKWADEY